MSKVRFNLHDKRTLRLVLRLPSGKFVFYTGIAINPADWNPIKQEVRRGALHAATTNAALGRLRSEVDRLYLDSLGSGTTLLAPALKIHLDNFWKGKQPFSQTVTVPGYIRSLMVNRVGANEIKPSTAKAFQTLANAIDKYSPGVGFDAIDLPFLQGFVSALTAENKAPNTVAGMVKRLKTVLSIAVDNGVTTNQAFRSARFRSKWVEVDTVYLTAEEVEVLAGLELTGLNAKVRDSFLIGCYTGLRYSDFSEINPGDFQTHSGVFMLKKRMVKTSRVVAVPIAAKAAAILERYNYKPPALANQVMNRRLKDVCKLAGINTMVKTEPIRGGVRSVEMRPKWSMVSTHTARRTFATLSYLHHVAAGLPIDGIMDITGHKSRVDFMKYIRVSAEERAALWVNVWAG